MADDINKGGEDFELNFAEGGTFDSNKEVTPNFDHTDASAINIPAYSPLSVTEYASEHSDSEEVLRVTFELASNPNALYTTARFGILESSDGASRAFVGVYETSSGGSVILINIAIDGQTIGSVANAINQYVVARAEVLNNRYSLSSNCLSSTPIQNGTNVWSVFFRSEDCGQTEETVASSLKEDINFYYTTVEPELAQSNPSQSLGGFISPTRLYASDELIRPISFTDSFLVFSSDSLSDYSILQIGDELLTVKEWKDSTAIIEERHAFGTPIRYHPEGAKVRGVGKNDIFDRILSKTGKQYRCIAVRNDSLSEIAREVKVFFKVTSRNTLSQTRFAIEIPKSEYYEGTATSGSVLVLIDSSLAGVHDDDHFVGVPLTMTSGGSAGQTRVVSGYQGSTGSFTLESELPSAIRSGNTFRINAAPSQLISSGTVSPSLSSTLSTARPYLITAFQSAIFATNGISIDVSGERDHGADLQPNDVIYIWLEREIDDNNDEFLNDRAIVTLSFSRT